MRYGPAQLTRDRFQKMLRVSQARCLLDELAWFPLDILSNASGVTSHLLMGRSRATEMNLSRDRCHPSALKKRSVSDVVVSCCCQFLNSCPWRRPHAYDKVAGFCTSPL